MLAGKEIIRLHPDALEIKTDVFGLGRTHEYDLTQVRSLRVVPLGASTFRLAAGLEEAEAGDIVARLKSRHNFA